MLSSGGNLRLATVTVAFPDTAVVVITVMAMVVTLHLPVTVAGVVHPAALVLNVPSIPVKAVTRV